MLGKGEHGGSRKGRRWGEAGGAEAGSLGCSPRREVPVGPSERF